MRPMPRYRSQRVSVPNQSVSRYAAAVLGAGIAFAVFGLFTSLAPIFLSGPLHHSSLALAGASAFAVFVSAVVCQTVITTSAPRPMIAGGVTGMVTGLALVVLAVWLPSPSLVLFLIGGVITGAGAGAVFKGVVATVGALADADRRAEAMAGMFLGGYVGTAVPVVGFGAMIQFLSPRLSLLIFGGVLAAGILAATPQLLGREQTSRRVPRGRHQTRKDTA